MEYRQLPHGNEKEKFGVLGLGFGGIGTTPVDEIEAIVRKAIDHGINFFDMCTAGATYAPVGRAIAGCREQVFLQVHLILLRREIALLEGIVLQGIPEGQYFLSAAPLNLGGADGAPCRAYLIDLEKSK